MGPINDSSSLLSDFPVPLIASNVPSLMQQIPFEVPVAVQSSSLTVSPAVQFEFPITVDSNVPVNCRHSQRFAEEPHPAPEQVPTTGVSWLPIPRMLKCSFGPCGVDVAVGAVEVGVLAVAVGVVAVAVRVAVRTVVAVTEAVTSEKIPLPQPELGKVIKVKATIVRMGRKRAVIASCVHPHSPRRGHVRKA